MFMILKMGKLVNLVSGFPDIPHAFNSIMSCSVKYRQKLSGNPNIRHKCHIVLVCMVVNCGRLLWSLCWTDLCRLSLYGVHLTFLTTANICHSYLLHLVTDTLPVFTILLPTRIKSVSPFCSLTLFSCSIFLSLLSFKAKLWWTKIFSHAPSLAHLKFFAAFNTNFFGLLWWEPF